MSGLGAAGSEDMGAERDLRAGEHFASLDSGDEPSIAPIGNKGLQSNRRLTQFAYSRYPECPPLRCMLQPLSAPAGASEAEEKEK